MDCVKDDMFMKGASRYLLRLQLIGENGGQVLSFSFIFNYK